MNDLVKALEAPTEDTLDQWLQKPQLASCGQTFIPTETPWRPDTTHQSVNWAAAVVCVPEAMQRWMQAALVYEMRNSSQATVKVLCSALTGLSSKGLNPLEMNDLIKIRDESAQASFIMIRAFIARWHANADLAERPTQALVDAYAEIPAKRLGQTYKVVTSLDPEEGPLTAVEMNALYSWAHHAFADGHLPPERYIFLCLLMFFGQRGAQLRMAVFDDVFLADNGQPKCRCFYAKQRGRDGGWRKKSEVFDMPRDLYQIIQRYKALVLVDLKKTYPDDADWDLAIQYVPLFRARHEGKYVFGNVLPVLIDLPNKKALETAPAAQFHVGAGSIKFWISALEKMENFPRSHRTGQPLKINKHRFKHTLGTDLSNVGAPDYVIKHNLMHTSKEAMKAYRQVGAPLMKLIEDTMADHESLIVQAFKGTIRANRALAINGDNPERQIENLAVCGADALCHLDAPYTCYACHKFQPLKDADHRKVLRILEQKRAQRIEAARTIPGKDENGDEVSAKDMTIASIFDEAIMACRQVIQECDALNAEEAVSHE